MKNKHEKQTAVRKLKERKTKGEEEDEGETELIRGGMIKWREAGRRNVPQKANIVPRGKRGNSV